MNGSKTEFPITLSSQTNTLEEAMVVSVQRGNIRESQHIVSAVEVDIDGNVLRSCGSPLLPVMFRSAAKPLQAIPALTHARSNELNLSQEEMAICCASHTGSQQCAALAASVLALSGYIPDFLVCGAPNDRVSPLHHGCSGNHAALILGAWINGFPLDNYDSIEHPIQQMIKTHIADFCGAPALEIAMDGCGVPTFGVSMAGAARSFAVLAQHNKSWSLIPDAMLSHPELIGGASWPDVRTMKACGQRIVAKTGAEGLLCLGLMDSGRGMAIKTADGSPRALGPATVSFLKRCGWISDDEYHALAELSRPIIKGPAGEPFAVISLEGENLG